MKPEEMQCFAKSNTWQLLMTKVLTCGKYQWKFDLLAQGLTKFNKIQKT